MWWSFLIRIGEGQNNSRRFIYNMVQYDMQLNARYQWKRRTTIRYWAHNGISYCDLEGDILDDKWNSEKLNLTVPRLRHMSHYNLYHWLTNLLLLYSMFWFYLIFWFDGIMLPSYIKTGIWNFFYNKLNICRCKFWFQGGNRWCHFEFHVNFLNCTQIIFYR